MSGAAEGLTSEERSRSDDLFATYRRTRDPALVEQLVTIHRRLALQLARRYDHRGIGIDDLQQVAMVGLLQAIERFDPERGWEFTTFATPTILGELRRHFRDRGWAVRVPRRVQELHLRVGTIVDELTSTLGRSPTIDEIATAARVSSEDVLEAMEASMAYRSSSIDEPLASTEMPADAAWDEAFFRAEDRVDVAQLLDQLPPREQLLIRLRYFEDMTQGQIAERLGISQMHVSRLLNRCIDELRRRSEAGSR